MLKITCCSIFIILARFTCSYAVPAIIMQQHVIFNMAIITFTDPETLIFWPQIQKNYK